MDSDIFLCRSNDALRQHGIIPPKVQPPPSPSPPPSPALASTLAAGPSIDGLDLLDAADSDEERLIDSYRRQRLSELKKESKNSRRFGSILPISREDYTREVTEASKAPEPDENEKEEGDPYLGTGVICFLYQDGGEPTSTRLRAQLNVIADRYPRTKIVSIVGNKCIENYPDRHLPTLFLYRNGVLRRQFVAYGKDRERPVEELEVLLMATNMVDPRKAQSLSISAERHGDDDEDLKEDDDQDSRSKGGINGRGTWTVNQRTTKIRTRIVGHGDNDDSDFDL